MSLAVEHDLLADVSSDANQFLTFTLNDQEFGIEILRVQEIKNFSQLTPIPNMPECIKGVMNLRGTVVPIIDLRTKFHMDAIEYNQFTVIIVVNVATRVMGLVVDAVSDVLNLDEESVKDTPEFGSGVDTQFIRGLARSGERLVTLLNIEYLLRMEGDAV